MTLLSELLLGGEYEFRQDVRQGFQKSVTRWRQILFLDGGAVWYCLDSSMALSERKSGLANAAGWVEGSSGESMTLSVTKCC